MPDSLGDLRSHVDAAHAAAEQLVREAEARAREHAANVPPNGWDAAPADDGGESRPAFPELAAVVTLLDGLRSSMPAELSQQLADAVRELLVAVRALIDWYIDRLERFTPGRGDGEAAGGGASRVRDIPID